jgi:glycosyltransferase involved in cell wall biosynthesis
LHPVKRIELLIDVAKRLRNDRIEFKCILVGDGDLEYVNDFKIRIVSENLLDHFELVGFKEDPAEWYKKFSVFILPSKVEAFSLSLLEAGASGVPCIAFDVGGNAEIIEHGKTGYLIPDQDLDTMNRIIEELYYDREKLIDMSKMAEKKILENFSMKQRYNKLLSVYGYEK